MNNPAASGRGIKADLLAVCCSALQFQDFAPRGGECTPTRFKHRLILGIFLLNEVTEDVVMQSHELR
jgi:hypothetical protein